MKYTTIRGLKHETARVMEQVEAGEVVEVRRRKHPVALLVPVGRMPEAELPDFAGRLRAIYGSKVLGVTGSELVDELRGER